MVDECGRAFAGNDAIISCRIGCYRSEGAPIGGAVQQELQKEELELVRARSIHNFEVEDYVLVAWVRKLGSAPVLTTT